MNGNHGWILLHRKIRDHWLWNGNHRFSKLEAWLDLLLMANYEPQTVMVGGATVPVLRGSMLVRIRGLASRWRWSRHSVRDFLAALAVDGMCVTQRDTLYTLITIVNYETYQNTDKCAGHPRATKKATKNDTPSSDANRDSASSYERGEKRAGHQEGHQSGHIKNKKEEERNNENNAHFERFWQLYPRKAGKGAAKKAWAKLKPSDKLVRRILEAVSEQIDSVQWARDGGKYIPHPTTWLNQERWDDELDPLYNDPTDEEVDAFFARRKAENGRENVGND